MKDIACIAGATSGSLGVVAGLHDPADCFACTDLDITPLEQPREVLAQRLIRICNSLSAGFSARNQREPDLSSVTLSLSSMTTESGQDVISAAIRDSFLPGQAQPVLKWLTRGVACYYSAQCPGDAIVLKAGTVAFAHAIPASHLHEPNHQHRVGGWGFLSGEDGGGYQIGRHLLYRYFQENDGRSTRTNFTNHMRALMGDEGVASVTSWITRVRHEQTFRFEVAQLALVATHLAKEENDSVCRDIVVGAAKNLSHCAQVALERARSTNPAFGAQHLTIILHGGLVQNSALYTSALCSDLLQGLARTIPSIQFHALKLGPVTGCIFFALRELEGWSWDDIHTYFASLDLPPSLTLASTFSPEVMAYLESIT